MAWAVPPSCAWSPERARSSGSEDLDEVSGVEAVEGLGRSSGKRLAEAAEWMASTLDVRVIAREEIQRVVRLVADFVIDGPLQDPTVKVSRTSMAPGILRDLAETLTEMVRDDEAEPDAS